MSPGKIAAQCIHAALGLNQRLADKDRCFDYLDSQMSVIVLEVSDAKFEQAKQERMFLLEEPFYCVRDAGYTEIPAGTETVLAFLEDDPRNS